MQELGLARFHLVLGEFDVVAPFREPDPLGRGQVVRRAELRFALAQEPRTVIELFLVAAQLLLAVCDRSRPPGHLSVVPARRQRLAQPRCDHVDLLR